MTKEVPTDSNPGPSEAKTPRHVIAVRVGIGLAIVAALALVSLPLISFFSEPDRVTDFIEGAGPWGPVVFVLVQIGQVFAAPIPGQVTGFVGGYLFGTFLGTGYAAIGGTIGCTLVFVLSRRLGRPFVERFVRREILQRFDFITEAHGVLALLVIFLVPIFPDDLICYLAGLTRIPLRRLILVAMIGRIPGYAVFSATGAGVAESNAVLVGVLVGVAVVAVGLALWQRKRVMQLLQHLATPHRNGGQS